MIDKIKKEQKDPFKIEFTDDRVTDAADSVAPENLETLEELKSYNERLSQKDITKSKRRDIEKRKKELEKRIEDKLNDAKKKIEN